MSWIPFYADDADFQGIISRLNSDRDIAIILPAGHGKWMAKAQVADLLDGTYCVWHMPGGALPLLSKNPNAPSTNITDPFKGWTEQQRGLVESVPFFGDSPNVFHLQKSTRGVEFADAIGLSSLGWIGNRYKSLGLEAASATALWWRRMQRWVKQTSVRKLPRWDSPSPPEPEIWVFPSACRRIEAGAARDANPHR